MPWQVVAEHKSAGASVLLRPGGSICGNTEVYQDCLRGQHEDSVESTQGHIFAWG